MSAKDLAIIKKLFELVAASLRRVRFYMFIIFMLSIVACTPKAVKRMMVDIPSAGYVHYLNYVQFDSFLPDWYQLYSILPGSKEMKSKCARRNAYSAGGSSRHITIINCSCADRIQVARLADRLQVALDAFERRFMHKIHVSNVDIRLYGHGVRHEERSTHIVRPKHLTFEMASVYMAHKPNQSERDIIRVTVHELFHIARHITRRDETSTMASSLPEETRASLFESCIDYDVYGSIEKSAFRKNMQFNPSWLNDVPAGYVSATGGIHAYNILSNIAGKDHRLSSESERLHFSRLCQKVVH